MELQQLVTNFFRTWTLTFVILKIEKHINLAEEEQERRRKEGRIQEGQSKGNKRSKSILFFGGIGARSQGFTLSRKALLLFNHTSRPFCTGNLEIGSHFLPRPTWVTILLF
jgi:hypothetical protein